MTSAISVKRPKFLHRSVGDMSHISGFTDQNGNRKDATSMAPTPGRKSVYRPEIYALDSTTSLEKKKTPNSR